MNFGKFDVMILLVMTIAIVSISFTMPALGLGGDSVNETEIPEYSIDPNRFDIAGEFPRNPGTPSSGVMWFNNSTPAEFSENQIWLDGDTSNGGTEMVIIDSGGEFIVNEWSSGTATPTTYNLTNEGQRFVYDQNDYEVAFEVTEYTAGEYYEVEFNVRDQPSGVGWIGRVPVVGGLFSGGEALAQTLAWIGSIAWWAVTVAWELTVNAINVLAGSTAFVFETATWLITTYTGIVSAAESWAAVFVAIPGLLLTIELGKLAWIGISLLPTT